MDAFKLKGRIDSSNVADLEKELFDAVKSETEEIVLDASELRYISSAGFRVLFKLKKRSGIPVKVINVPPEVYEIFDVTGFTELFDVHRRFREISIDNAKLLGKGGNGAVYRLDKETIVKVYYGVTNPLEKIEKDQNSSREVFVHGINTAIPYDVVKVGDEYGVIFEMVEADSIAQRIMKEPDRLEEYTRRMARLLKQLHSTEFMDGELPDARDTFRERIDISGQKGFFDAEELRVMRAFVDSIPDRNTFIHGDFHPGNILVKDDELILIDVDDAGMGHPILDLMGMAVNYEIIPGYAEEYCGIKEEYMRRMWPLILREYFETDDPEPYSRAISEIAYLKVLLGVCANADADETHKNFIDSLKGNFFDKVDHFVIYP